MNLSRATYQKYFAFDVNGHPLNGGRVSTYVDGTDTPAATYKNREGTILNPNPIVLDARGEAEIWLDTAVTYKFIVTDRHGRKVGQYDHVTSNTRTFEAQGSSTITTEESTVDGKTIVTFKVKDGSVGREQLKNPRNLVVDEDTMWSETMDDSLVIGVKGGAGGGVTQDELEEAVATEARRANAYTDSAVGALSIPTKTSELENDAGFLTSAAGEWVNVSDKFTPNSQMGSMISKPSFFINLTLNLIKISGDSQYSSGYGTGKVILGNLDLSDYNKKVSHSSCLVRAFDSRGITSDVGNCSINETSLYYYTPTNSSNCGVNAINIIATLDELE